MKKFFNGIKRVFIGGFNVLTNRMDETTLKRYEICKNCDRLMTLGHTQWCSECGCNIPAKCASPEEECLLKKW